MAKKKELRFKVGDKVSVKGTTWYNNRKNKSGFVDCPSGFMAPMAEFCGKVVTIAKVFKKDSYYKIEEDKGRWCWDDEVFK